MFNERHRYVNDTPVSSIDMRVLDSEINPYRQMHVDRIFQYMQEVASVNLYELQKDHADIREIGYAWIVNGISMRLKRLPLAREVLTYTSWPGLQNALFINREYSFSSGAEWLGGACASWFVADAATHRPLRLETVGNGILGKWVEESAIGMKPKRFRGSYLMPEYTLSYKKRAEFSDSDINGHMSNTRYIAWCMDVMQAAGLADQAVLGIDINFLSELYSGDLVDVYLTKGADVTPEQRLAWLGQKKTDPGEAFADAYIHALKVDGSLCFKAQLFCHNLLQEREEAGFLKQV